MGTCKCKTGFFAPDCSKKRCTGKGVVCTKTSCRCGPKWARSECDYTRGKCQCKRGISLAHFFFSSHCAKRKCPGACSERTQSCTCSGHGTCDYEKGKCSCKPGFTGNNCAFHIQVQDASDSRTNLKQRLLKSAMGFSLHSDLNQL